MSAEPTDAPPPPPAAPAPVRRGRGTFGHRLRTEEMELRQQQLMQSMEASSILTSATTTVVLPATVMGVRSRAQAEEADALAAEQSAYAEAKRNIPLDLRTSNGAPTGGGTTTTASRIHFDPNLRSQFNMYGSGTEEVEDAGTIRQLLFCGDKRRRYCLLVGDLQSTKRQVTLKLFGHRGPKPFKLQNRLIRLVNLSIGKPRVYVPKVEEGEEAEPGSEEEGEDGPRVEEDENDVAADDAKKEGSTAEQDESPVEEEKEEKEGEEEVAAAPSIPACPMGLGGDDDDAPSESSVPRKAAIGNEAHSAGRSHSVSGARDADEFDDDEAGDVDQYLENDEVVPLTVQLDDSDLTHEHSLANSPMLTSRSYAALTDYFLREFRFLFSMSDVRSQHVTINLNVGAAYCCLARHGSHSTPLKHATFGEFVSRMNNESMQLYFIKDCPPCVSRAVDIHCGAQCQEATLTVVKIYFFSNERQGKSVARAVWDSCHNGFRLLDMENTGVSFNWTIFSLDESTAASRGETAAYVPEADDAAGEPTTTTAGRSKTVAYPVEVEFRAFRRWKQHNDHPAAPLAEAILEKLSVAEHNLLNHGSSIGYERMDLSHVCEADYDSEDFNVDSIVVEHTTRVKPFGTDLIVDSTTSLFIENFAAARQLKESITFHGEQEVAARQNAANNNYLRQLEARRGRGTKEISFEDLRDGSLQPTSKLTFFRSRGSTIHWKLSPAKTTEENIAPMEQALLFTKRVLETANCIERNSARSGEAPSAL